MITGTVVALLVLAGTVSSAETNNTSDQQPLSIKEIVNYCINNTTEGSFDILIDVVSDPMKSPFYVAPNRQRSELLGTYVNGRYFSSDPLLLYEHITIFVAEIERQMDANKLYIGIVDNDNKTYYLNASSNSILEKTTTTTTTTTRAPSSRTMSSILDAFVNFGNQVAGILVDASGIKIPSLIDDENWPSVNVSVRLAKMTRKLLDGRAMGYPLHLPDNKSSKPRFTVVITDGARKTKPSQYPDPDHAVILDLGGFWSAANREYNRHNVLLMEYPQDLIHFVHIARFMMCQSLDKDDNSN